MARIKTINRYPLAAYAQLFETARKAADKNEVFSIPCETYKEAQTRRFELYGFMRALGRSNDLEHMARVKGYQSFKLVLWRTGFGDQTLLQFQAYDNTKFALDIMQQVQIYNAVHEDGQAQAQTVQAEIVASPYAPLSSSVEPAGNAQTAAFLKLGYGGTTKK